MNRITLAHGAGGREMNLLLDELIFRRVPEWMKLVEGGLGIDFPDDSAAIPIGDDRFLVVSVDSYTVNPIFFPGGDIGRLAASGTINDVLMLGGKPVAALDAIVVEEGIEKELLEKVVNSMLKTFEEENVRLIGGDLKVMPRGQLDKMIITTTGLGIAEHLIIDKNLRPGDRIIVSGNIGEHGAAILAAQQGLTPKDSEFRSDVKPLTDLMLPLIKEYGRHIHAAGDPTRGGLAMTLNEWAKASGTMIIVDESEIPIKENVASYCEMLGIDPLTLASEGIAVLGVEGEAAEEILEAARRLGYSDARVIGEVREREGDLSLVIVKTHVGGHRILEPPTGELVPRIC